MSPIFQQAALDFHGIAARYERWETSPEELSATIQRLRGSTYLGANVTVPHKEAVIPLVDTLDVLAERIGAVNTIVNRGGKLYGFNTDVTGFREAVERDAGYRIWGKHAVLLGAGGAARAVAFGLVEEGAELVTIANRHPERAESLAREVSAHSTGATVLAVGMQVEELSKTVTAADMLINATSVGLRHTEYEDISPVPLGILHRGLLVCDLVYNPLQTMLLRGARHAGAATLDGLSMLIYQGATSFALWTEKEAPIGLMFARAREALERGE